MLINRNVILVTGASSGIGLAVANYLFEKGYIVYAAARSFQNDFHEDSLLKEGRLHKVYLDVTKQPGIDELISMIKNREGRLDVLINCAVHYILGSVEDMSIEEFEGVIDAGLIGTLRMCKSVVPIMREQKDGLIINFSSLLGLFGIPFHSPYTAAKFAIEGLSEVLSMEVKDFGINVVIVEPGDHRSGSALYRLHAKKADSRKSVYYERFKKAAAVMERDEANGSEPMHLAALIEKIITNPKPKIRYKRIDQFEQKLVIIARKVLPGRLFEMLVADNYYKGL
jgi:NAD(P)-dependent dehydrogenase (short-subunit alcohol dehydrogenase family)